MPRQIRLLIKFLDQLDNGVLADISKKKVNLEFYPHILEEISDDVLLIDTLIDFENLESVFESYQKILEDEGFLAQCARSCLILSTE